MLLSAVREDRESRIHRGRICQLMYSYKQTEEWRNHQEGLLIRWNRAFIGTKDKGKSIAFGSHRGSQSENMTR